MEAVDPLGIHNEADRGRSAGQAEGVRPERSVSLLKSRWAVAVSLAVAGE